MNGRPLTVTECETLCPGEALALTAVLAVMAVSIIAVVVYRLFKSKKGTAKAPGGWQFNWE